MLRTCCGEDVGESVCRTVFSMWWKRVAILFPSESLTRHAGSKRLHSTISDSTVRERECNVVPRSVMQYSKNRMLSTRLLCRRNISIIKKGQERQQDNDTARACISPFMLPWRKYTTKFLVEYDFNEIFS